MSTIKKQTPRRKALNTLLQGLGVTLGSALIVVLVSLVGSSTSYAELGAGLVAYSTFQAVATAGLSWLMRGYFDKRREAAADPTHLED